MTEPQRKPAVPPATAANLDAALAEQREVLQRLFPLPPKRKPRRVIKTTGGVLLGLCALLGWLNPVYHSEQYHTARGEQRPLTLADGSRLLLDTDSRLQVTWRLRSREVSLEQGQVRFAVSHAWYRPFLVQAGEMQVRVVGTVFDVRFERQQLSVSVLEGKVALTRQDASGSSFRQLLLAGQHFGQQAGGLPQMSQPPVAEGWAEGKLVFNRVPLVQAVAEAQRYYPHPIRLQDEQLGQQTFSGVFETRNVRAMLLLLPQVLPLSVQPQADGSLLLLPRRG